MQTGDVAPPTSRHYPPTASEREERARLIRAEQIRSHYTNMPSAFIGSALIASIMAAMLFERVAHQALLVWLAAAYLNSGVRFALWKCFKRIDPPLSALPRWGRYVALSVGFAGLVWGAGGIVMHTPGSIAYQLFVLLVTLGLAFTSAYLTGPYMPAFVAFACPTFVLSAVPFFFERDLLHVGIGLTVLIALPLVIRYASGVSRVFLESLDVRLRNADLVEELRAQKRAAEEANVAKSRFLAVASHDLRQPLHALGLFVQALQDCLLPAHERQLVNNVRRSLDAMEELFEALLDISRLDAGVVQPRPETFPLATLFDRLRFEYAAIAQQKGLTFTVMNTSAYVRSDPTLLSRIVRNLVANAVRYTDRGGVVLGCRRAGEGVRIEVWDTGRGIPADKRCAVFQEFIQLENPERDRRKGLGLGLAIVQRLARLLDHAITLRSVVSKGSVFAVTVPRGRREDHVPAETVSNISGAFDLTGLLVLVIDDEIAVREGMEALLVRWGCEVIAASSGADMRDCLSALRRIPDFIISDYRLAREETGAAVIEMLRTEFNAEVPALLVTGDTGAERPRDGDAGGGLPILHKPLNPARLRTLMANLVRKPTARKPRRFG